MIRFYFLAILLCSQFSHVAASDENNLPEFKGGRAVYFFLLNSFPDDSLFLDYIETPSIDHNGDLRLKFDWHTDRVSINTHYQMIAQYGDSITLSNSLPVNPIIPDRTPNDDNRLFDLTRVITQDDNNVLAHRLDRLSIDVTTDNSVVRFGRQVVSWGNGLIYTPMDFFNPFDPAAIDKEYKPGDDMLYGQYLQESGNDLQAVWVIRRNSNGDVSNDVDSLAAKYHGFVGNNEYDLLLAEHYDDTILGIGGIADIYDAIWRGDITLTHTQTDDVISLVTSLTYSWQSWGHNTSGVLEYFYNGFGQSNGDYSPASLSNNTDLTDRLIRGELFTLGRHYIVASAMFEVTPLWLLTPNVFINASDGSFLAQLVSSYDIKQDWQLLAAISLPVGASGTEFGGIDSGITGKQLSTEFNLFAQLAWYF